MEHQFSLQFENPEKLTKEDILNWPKEVQDAKYEKLFGQKPLHITPEQVAEGILHPEKESAEIIRRRIDDDKEEVAGTYRRPTSA
jgi:hypothetical protein